MWFFPVCLFISFKLFLLKLLPCLKYSSFLPTSLISAHPLRVKVLSYVRPFATLWTIPCQALHPWNSPGQNSGVGSHSLLQGILPTQRSEPRSPALQADSTIWATRACLEPGIFVIFSSLQDLRSQKLGTCCWVSYDVQQPTWALHPCLLTLSQGWSSPPPSLPLVPSYSKNRPLHLLMGLTFQIFAFFSP